RTGTGGIFTPWLVADVLAIALPGLANSVKLVEQRRGLARVGAAVRAVGSVRAAGLGGICGRGDLTAVRAGSQNACIAAEVSVCDAAVRLCVLLRGLTRDHRLVVVLAGVSRAEVVLQQHALSGQRLP